MIHHRRLKTVKTSYLFKSSNIVKKSDHLRKPAVLLRKAHSFCYFRSAADYSLRMYDFQFYFLIFPAELVQIGVKHSPGML